jgi:hypothetical protein
LEKIELSTAIHPIINLLEGNANKKNIKIMANPDHFTTSLKIGQAG